MGSNILHFVKKQMAPSVTSIETIEEFREFVNSDPAELHDWFTVCPLLLFFFLLVKH